MNILPKKRWHVRTRDNIARVRRDEAAAEAEEKERHRRIEVAEKEARVDILKAKAREKYGVKKEEEVEPTISRPENKHINFFFELEENEKASNKTNADHDREAKEEREKEEIKIGYLTYLGQDTNELTGAVSWYNKLPPRLQIKDEKLEITEKPLDDPLKNIRSYLETLKTSKVKKKKEKRSKVRTLKKKLKKKHKDKYKRSKKSKKRRRSTSSSSSDSDEHSKPKFDINKLREERIMREQAERKKAEETLSRLRGETVKEPISVKEPVIVQKYNAQYNPHLARQNFIQY